MCFNGIGVKKGAKITTLKTVKSYKLHSVNGLLKSQLKTQLYVYQLFVKSICQCKT